jgi:hypothetical protein
MPRASAAQTVLPLGDQPEPEDICGWDQILSAAFADPNCTSGFLSRAEEAVRAQPGDGLILLLATTAALLDENPARAQVFLKRFSKRYVAVSAYHLLRALALAEQSKLGLARSVLEAHQLTNRFSLFPAVGPGERGSFVSTIGFSNATSVAIASAEPPAPSAAAPKRPSRASLTGVGWSGQVRRLRHCPHRLRRLGYR